MFEPGRICRLGCYTKFALDVLCDSTWYYGDPEMIGSANIRMALDNELEYVQWDNRPILDLTMRRRVAKCLERYSLYGHKIDLDAKLLEAAPCLRLIVLKKDGEAEAKWPKLYGKLKGKPLNPIQVCAIETLLKEIDGFSEQNILDGVMTIPFKDEYMSGQTLEELGGHWFNKKQTKIFKKLSKIRGW